MRPLVNLTAKIFSVAALLHFYSSFPVLATEVDLTPYQQVRYVSVSTGSDTSGDGSQAGPWMTLTHALSQITDAASANKYAVLIASGTYTGTGSSAFTMKEYVHLYGGLSTVDWTRVSAVGKTLLDGENVRRVVKMASNCTVDGLVITRGNATSGAGIYCTGITAGKIASCTITNNTASNNGGGIYWSQSTLNIVQCNIGWNTSFEDGGGLDGRSTNTVNITNCVIHHNRASNLGAGIRCNGSSPKLTGCTIADNYGSGLTCEGTCSPKIYNCTFWNHGSELVGGTPQASYNDIQGGWPGSGNINAPPVFVDPVHGDYRLREGSPCIDRGNSAYGPSTDFYGTTRPQGSKTDMGAYESPATYTQGALPDVTPVQRFVRWDAPEGGDGLTWQTAYQSIGEALDQVFCDDDIWVASGTYHEAIIMEPSMSLYGGFAGTETYLSERDLTAHSTIIDASGLNRTAVIGADKARLNGFTLTGGQSDYGGGLNCCAVSPKIEQCTLKGNSTTSLGGAMYCEYASPTFTNCVITKNTTSFYGGAAGVCLYSSPTLDHCTIIGNSAGQGNALRFHFDSHPKITNCILWNHGTEIQADGAEVSVTYCGVQGGWEGTGNIEFPPMLKEPGNGDFHLLDGSPCIGSATLTAGITTDIEGNPRPLGSAPDMGAYEAPASYVPSTPVVEPTRYYVKLDAPEGGDGSSWEKAFNSINTALDSTWPGDEVWVASGRYNEGVVLETGVAVYGGFLGTESSLSGRNWVAYPTIIDATKLSRIAVVGANNTVLDGFIITNGNPLGVYCLSTSLWLVNCTITQNKSDSFFSDGAGIKCERASVKLESCTISLNSSGYRSAGIYSSDSEIALSNCTVLNNAAFAEGGGVYCTGSILLATDCILCGNTTGKQTSPTSYTVGGDGGGGGIFCESSSISLLRCTLSGNVAAEDGGGLRCGQSTAVVRDCTVSSNVSLGGRGSGISISNSTGTIEHCALNDNESKETVPGQTGGLYCSTSTFQIIQSTFTAGECEGVDLIGSAVDMKDCEVNSSKRIGVYCKDSPAPTLLDCTISGTDGVGLYCNKCAAMITDCTFTGNGDESYFSKGGSVYCFGNPSAIFQDCLLTNSSAGYGAGFYIVDSSPELLGCKITENYAFEKGGGIYCISNGNPVFENCLIVSNTAREGGAIHCGGSMIPRLMNCTLSGNIALGGTLSAGGIYFLGGDITVTNSILWNNLPKELRGISDSASLFYYNDIMGGFPGTGNIDADPLFVDPENGDFHLRENSPCIGKGIGPESSPLVPLFDFDGDPRSGQTCDMGADEYVGPTRVLEWVNY